MKTIIRIAACSTVCLAAAVQAVTVSAAEHEGWETVGKKRYYYENGEALTGEQFIDGIPYLFAPNGAQQTGWQTVDGKRYFYDKDGTALFGEITWRGETYYVSRELGKITSASPEDAKAGEEYDTYGVKKPQWRRDQDAWHYADATGETVIDGTVYLFDENGCMLTGWQTASDNITRYYDAETHLVQTGWFEADGVRCYSDPVSGRAEGRKTVDGAVYLFEKGTPLTGYQTDAAGDTRYYDPETGIMQTGFVSDNGNTCYFDTITGIRKTDWFLIGTDMYYAGEDGSLASGFTEINGLTYYFSDDFKRAAAPVRIDGKIYVLDDMGIPQIGWFTTLSGDRYYSDINACALTGVQTLDDKNYYFNEDGILQTGWIDTDSACYYADADGVLATGFKRIDGIIYYFEANGKRGAGPVAIDGKTYLLSEKGIPQVGWYTAPNGDRYYGDNTACALTGLQTIGDKRYYFNETGIMQNGWLKIDTADYYAGADGAFVTGFVRVEGTIYFFDETGARGSGPTLYQGKTYLLSEKGIPQVGWYTTADGTKYYGDSTAAAVTGWQEINNKGYYFYVSGILAVSTTIDDFSIDANGVARSQMAVTIDGLLANTNYTPTSIFTFCTGRYRYSRVENTRTVNQLISAGWDSLVRYTMSNRRGVCYHLAATYEYFCKRAGYTTRLIHATHSTGNHYWVQVLVNGAWQNYDPTYSNRNNISWDTQIALGDYIVLGVVDTYYDARGAYTGCNYTAW